MSCHRLSSTFLLLLAAGSAPAPAAEVPLRTGDGLELRLDSQTGEVRGLLFDGIDLRDTTLGGGLWVRDRVALNDVPPGAVNQVLNPSFETDADTDGMPDNWIFFDEEFRGAQGVWSTDAFDGRRSVQILSRRGGIWRQSDFPVQGGVRYLVQARARGTARSYLYVTWKNSGGDYLLAEASILLDPQPGFTPVFAVLTAPAAAATADLTLRSISDGDVTFDLAEMVPAPPAAFSALAGPVTATAGGATQTSTLAALGLRADATWRALADRIDLEVTLTDTSGQDRALDAGLNLPLLPALFWDNPLSSRIVSQQFYSETFAYTWWGRNYNDGPWGDDRSVFPFAPLTLAFGQGLGVGYDPALGPQDLRLFHSTYQGESFTSRFRLGLAPEAGGLPRQARFRLSLYRLDGANPFRAGLERLYRTSAGSFENRLARPGGWVPWRDPAGIPAADFGLTVHTWPGNVAGDEAAGIATFGYLESFDYWLPLGDFTAEPSAAEARQRLADNANGSGVDPVLQEDARSVVVSGLHDPAGEQVLRVYQASWMPGSGWSAVCATDPDPQVSDSSGNAWTARYRLHKQALDLQFASARSAGLSLEGAYVDWFRSSLSEAYNHRREHISSCDVPLSYDPATRTPALFESDSHFEPLAAVSAEMRSQGLLTMARDIHLPSFWASPMLDLMAQEVNWDSLQSDESLLAYYRAAAGRKPYLLMLDADYANLDVEQALGHLLLWGLWPSPGYDYGSARDFWDVPALVERDRPVYQRFLPLFALEARAGWRPETGAQASDPAVALERWGDPATGPVLFSARNGDAAPRPVTVSVDLAALGIDPARVGPVNDLVGAGRRPHRVQGTVLSWSDDLAAGAARLYHVHLDAQAPRLVLYAVKRGADVELSWTGPARDPYELLSGDRPDLGGAPIRLVGAPPELDPGVVTAGPSRYYSLD